MLEGYIHTLSDPLGEARVEFPDYLERFGQPKVRLTLEKALDSLSGPIKIAIAPLGEAQQGFPGYLKGFGRPEVGPTLDQFSNQQTSFLEWNEDELKTHLGLASYTNALKMVEFFGATMFGKVVEYQGILGYDLERIRRSELSYCCPLDLEEPPSELLRARNMGVYGSGGLPNALREGLKTERINSATMIESDVRQYSCQADVQSFKCRSINFDRLAWCRAAISIEMCWHVSTTLDTTWGGWLLRVAVHAACTLERARSGALETSMAAITLFQLSREIGYGLQTRK